jgi:hypothetical protein
VDEDVSEKREVGGLVILMMKITRLQDGRLVMKVRTVIPAKHPEQHIPNQIWAFQQPEHAATNVRYRTYNLDKQANTDKSVNAMTVFIADLRAIHTMIRGICVAAGYCDCRIE